MKYRLLFTLLCCLSAIAVMAQKQFSLKSPDGRIEMTVSIGDELTYSVFHDAEPVVLASPISLSLMDGEVWGKKARLSERKVRSVKQVISSPFYRKSEIQDEYNELILHFRGQWGVEFRAYNDGVAYRFVNRRKAPFMVKNEGVSFVFPEDVVAIAAPPNNGFSTSSSALAAGANSSTIEQQFTSSFENTYITKHLSELDKSRLFMLPLVVNLPGGKRACITESDLESYPGLYLNAGQGVNTLSGFLAPYPKETVQGGHNMLQLRVKQREEYIAKVNGERSFPWRTIIIANTDKDLADSDMTYKLAAPSRITDLSWIRPGKVAWEWWNDCNLEGVDFETGVNNDTYKYYIDFASQNGIEYVILDEGWSVNLKADLMQVVPEINLPELVKYANARSVGIILWAGYHAFNRDMENICRHYADMGVKGFKIDFMDRDDQEMVDFNYRAAETAARYKLILDLHGMYKPAGLNRTYPNVLNFEGVFGLEQMKWQSPAIDMMTYDVTIPFIRQLAGPMDYTQGAMRNAIKSSFYPSNSEPMSQGTRCHQLAAYLIFDSPFNMLCDSPTNYLRELESLKFIAGVPTVWDETITLDGRIGEYIITARRHKDTWYIGGFTNWIARDLVVDLSFLGSAKYNAILFKDGVNAHRKGTDYKKENILLDGKKKLVIHVAPGGGFAIQLELK